jgi:phage shock protein E
MLTGMKRPDNYSFRCRPRPKTVALMVGLLTSMSAVSACGAEAVTRIPVEVVEDDAVAADSVTVISELVDGERGKQLVDQGAIVIDVRTPGEYAEGHVPGALLIDVSAPTFAEQIGQLDPNAAYVVYCRSGNRSAAAVTQMLTAGFTELYDMGPLTAWAQAGYPVVTN